MVDKELKNYINSLLKQGYDIDNVKDVLIKAGHDINKVEKVACHVFELFHKDLTQYIDREINKGKNIEQIKQDLIKLGHSEEKLKKVIKYHRSKKPFIKSLALYNFISEEKRWMISWFKIFFAIFGFVLFTFMVLLLMALRNTPEQEYTYEQQLEICSTLNSGSFDRTGFQTLCLAIVSGSPGFCDGLQDQQARHNCIDAYSLYSFYKLKNKVLCSAINNPSLKEYCFQLFDKSCNDYFGYGQYCESIIKDKLSECSSKSNSASPLIGDCFDNFNLYKAINGDSYKCQEISNDNLRIICKAGI